MACPARQIVANAGVEGSVVVGKILENKSQTFGFDAQTEQYAAIPPSRAFLASSARLGPKPRTSKPAPGHKIYPYLLRGLSIKRPNQVWAADITYIPIGRGFLYLVAVIDWASRAVQRGFRPPSTGRVKPRVLSEIKDKPPVSAIMQRARRVCLPGPKPGGICDLGSAARRSTYGP